MYRTSLVILGIVWIVAPGSVTADQKQPSSKQDEKRENEAVREAERDVEDARGKLKAAEGEAREASKAWKSALTERQAAAAALQEVRERLEAEHQESTGLAEARRRLKESAAELASVSRPILEKVHQLQPDVVSELAGLHEHLRQQDDPVLRREAATKIPPLTARLRELEREALRQDPQAAKLLETVDQQESRVRDSVKKFDLAVERDPNLRRAQQAFTMADRRAEQAEESAAKATRRVNDARNALAKAMERLQQKQLQDRRDDNRKPKKK